MSVGTYVLLAALNRAISAKSKTKIKEWCDQTAVHLHVEYKSSLIESQNFWDNFDKIGEAEVEQIGDAIAKRAVELENIDRDCLVYDTTNYYNYWDVTNDSELARMTKSKAGKNHLRHVGLALAVDRDHGLPLFHRLYPANNHDSKVFSALLKSMYDQTKFIHDLKPDRVSPFFVPYMIADMASGLVSIMNDLRGPNHAIVSACSTGANAIGDAYEIIKRGDARMMIAGGSEAPVNPIGVAGFCACRAMTSRNDEPARASRPFDRDRDGFVMGEGAGTLVLEDRDHALARGAKIYCEIVGYGFSADAYHITSPHPEGRGAAKSMNMALSTLLSLTVRSCGDRPVGQLDAHS
jgi:hypothetical protein